MYILSIVFSNHCDLDCSYCCIQSKNESPILADMGRIKDFVSKYAQQGSVVEFYGGEPTLHKKEIFEIIDFCKSLNMGIRTRLYTNGLFVNWTEEEILSLSNNLDEVLVSLDGSTFEENRQRFESQAQFESVLNNIRTMRKADELDIALSSVLYGRVKYERMFENYKFFSALGIDTFSYEPVTIYRTDKAVIIPRDFFGSLFKGIMEISRDICISGEEKALFVAKEILAASWYHQGDKDLCSKNVRAISPRGNIYMCRDHAANEEEMFYAPKVIQFFNKNNLKSDNESFPVIEENEKDLTHCPVKNIQYKQARVEKDLYWLKGSWQDFVVKPMYSTIIAVNSQDEKLPEIIDYFYPKIDTLLDLAINQEEVERKTDGLSS